MTRIVFFVGALHGGGGKRLMVNLAKQLPPESFSKVLLSVSSDGPVLSWLGGEVEHYSLLKSAFEDSQARRTIAMKSLCRVSALIREIDPDVIITDGPIPLILMWLVSILNRRKARWIARKGTRIGRRPSSRLARLRRLVRISTLRLLYNSSDQIVVPSAPVKRDVAAKLAVSPRKITVIPNPVNITEVQLRSEEENLTLQGVFDDIRGPTIAVVNRLVKRKHTELVMDAFSAISGDWPDARLLLVGDGPERSNLERRASACPDQIRFLGHLENPLPVIARSSALVLASEDEGFGYVIVEAMICGTIPIAFDLDHGPSTIIDDELNGILLPGISPTEELQRALRRVLAGDPTLEPVRSRAMISARKYGSEIIARDYETAIRSVCHRLS